MTSKKEPLVSFIVATYNEELHIANCINSVLNQEYENFEILVTDDGSEDETVQIVEEFSRKHKNVKLFHQKHFGVARAWNNSFRQSKGDILITLGADMTIGKRFVFDMIKPIIDGECPGTFPDHEVIKNYRENLWSRAKGRTRVYGDTVYLAIRRDAWLKAGGVDEKRGYDSDQTFYEKLKILPKRVKTEIYHEHPSSFKEFWKQSLWIGRSMTRKNRILSIMSFVFIPLLAVYKSIQMFREDPYLPFLIFLPIYNSLKFLAFFIGNMQYLLVGTIKR